MNKRMWAKGDSEWERFSSLVVEMKKKMNGFWGSFVFTEARAETDFESVEPPTASPFHVSFEGLSLLSDFKMYPHIF